MGAADPHRPRRRLVDARSHLRPGVYRRVGGRTWLRFGSRAPSGVHVRRSLRAILRTTGAGRRPLVRALLARATDVVGSAFVVLPGRTRRGFSAVSVSYDGGYVLLDRSHSEVVRRHPHRLISPSEERLRREWSVSVSAPEFRVGGDRSVVHEALVAGEKAARASLPDQIAHVRAVFAMYSQLSQRRGRSRPDLLGSGSGVVDDAGRTFGPYRGDPHVLRDARLDWVVPSMPDPTPWNLLVGCAGPVFVDVHPIVLRPHFFAPVTLLGSWMLPSPPLKPLYFGGDFDDVLADLLGAAGSDAPITDRLRGSLLIWSLHAWVWLLEWMLAGYVPPGRREVEARLQGVLRARGLGAALDCPP